MCKRTIEIGIVPKPVITHLEVGPGECHTVHFFETTMSGEIFNPNPTVFATTRSTRSLPPGARLESLWLDDGENRDEELDDSNEYEAIDQDEIFGTSRSLCLCHLHTGSSHTLIKSSYGRSPTLNIET